MKAPPVISPLDFFGIHGELILIEYDDGDQLNLPPSIYFSPYLDAHCRGAGMVESKIERVVQAIKKVDADVTFVIHRIELFNADRTELSRGSLIKGHLSLLGPRTLKGRNVILTSEKEEHMLRAIVDRFIDLKQHS